MEKKLEDFLNLYLGCMVEYGYEGKKKVGQLTGKVEQIGWEVFDAGASFDIYHNVKTELIKPILRHLSDMSEEEKKETYKLSNRGDYEATAEMVRYLLSKHFDLFQLIESGLAIDSTKLTGWQFGWQNEQPLPETKTLGT